jgi:hypothetical protein
MREGFAQLSALGRDDTPITDEITPGTPYVIPVLVLKASDIRTCRRRCDYKAALLVGVEAVGPKGSLVHPRPRRPGSKLLSFEPSLWEARCPDWGRVQPRLERRPPSSSISGPTSPRHARTPPAGHGAQRRAAGARRGDPEVEAGDRRSIPIWRTNPRRDVATVGTWGQPRQSGC